MLAQDDPFWCTAGDRRRDHPPLPARSIPAVLSLLLTLLVVLPTPRAVALDPRRALTQYQRQSWGAEDGLPSTNVVCVTQGQDGYLWLGTEEGMARFDGVRTRIFDRQTDPILGGDTIYSILEDPRHPGTFLLGTASGLCRFADGQIHAFPSDAAPCGQPGRLLLRDPADGAFWIRSVRGLFHVTAAGKVSGPVEAASGWPYEKIRSVCRDRRGYLWVGTARGLYRQHATGGEGENQRFDLQPGWVNKAVDYLTPARGGGLWVGSRDAGTGCLREDGSFHPRPGLEGCVVETLLEDRAGMLWVGTNGSGLFRLPAGEAAGTEPPPASFTTENGLIHNLVNDLFEDREGNLWIGTQGGLQVLRDARFVNFGRPEGLAGDDVRSVFEDPRGQLWIGHENGLGMLDPATNRMTNYPLPPSPRRPANNRVLCVARGDDDDTLLAGTTAGLVRWHEGRMDLLPVRDDLDQSVVRALCRDGEGGYWVGTGRGLYQVQGDEVQARFTTAVGLASDVVRALHVDRRGDLWIATDGGLSRRGADGRIVNFLNSLAGRADGTVLCFFEDPASPDELFVGTEFGLHRLRITGNGEVRITRYSMREGLFNDTVWSVLGDGQGNLWMSSNKGISRVARADLTRFDRGEIASIPHVSYGVTDGLRTREANGGHQPAAWRDHAGQLWFATVKGAVVVDPARVAPNPLPPPVHVEEFVADGRGVTSPAGGDAFAPKLAAGTQNLDFRYTALSLIAPEAIRFRYQLIGFDPDWKNAGSERTAHYTNLPPGDYGFRVQAANADGVWNETGATLAFHLRPFFHQTMWFRALVLGATVILLWACYQGIRRHWQGRLARAEAELLERRRTQEILRQAKEEAEREHAVAECARAEAEGAKEEAERANAAKSEFLSRMSHELRTPLNAILGFGQLLELEALSTAQTESVEHILGGGRHLLGLVDEILDLARVESGEALVRSEEIELAPLLVEAAGLVEPLARERGVSLRIEPRKLPGAHVQADRQRLKQVLLNLLANAIKYNRAVGGEVVIGVEEVVCDGAGAPRQRVFVRDTGLGIGPAGLAKLFTPFERLGAAYGPIEGTGLGLAVSKQLAEAMHGAISVESTVGVGSTFRVELPIGIPLADTTGASPTPPPRPAPSPPRSAQPGDSMLLYIEDNESNRQLVQSALAQHRPDLRLQCVRDGTAGLAAARLAPHPSLILLDLQLPDLTGDEVLGRLREDQTTGSIPVVVLSADATARSRARLRAAGAAEYLTKPLELRQLLEVLAGHLPTRSDG